MEACIDSHAGILRVYSWKWNAFIQIWFDVFPSRLRFFLNRVEMDNGKFSHKKVRERESRI